MISREITVHIELMMKSFSCRVTKLFFQSADAFPTLLQTIRFKSYLLSMGIANPVTRETYGSGTQYHMQLAKQLAGILQAPLEVGESKPLLSKHC